jgi:hypothetical protein
MFATGQHHLQHYVSVAVKGASRTACAACRVLLLLLLLLLHYAMTIQQSIMVRKVKVR